MPAKSVFKYDCSRCGRTWYEEEEKKTARMAIEMECSDDTHLRGSFETLCDTCETTVRNYVASVLKNLKKVSSIKPKAKKEGTSPSPKPAKGPSMSIVSDTTVVNTPQVEVIQPTPFLSKLR